MGRAHSTRQPGTSGRPAVSREHEDRALRSVTAVPAEVRATWLATAQRLAGNQAVTRALLPLQRDEPPQATAEPASAPGRVPTAEEQEKWDDPFPGEATFRILVEPAYGYNCFAWAVGNTSRDITSDTIFGVGGYPATLDGWTKYLVEKQGFGRYADLLDASADLILYGASATQVMHAARKADQPYGSLTFSSKLGERNLSPVILHDPAAMSGGYYGHALRSFWKGAASEPVPAPAPAP